MKRRNFLKMLGIGAVITTVAAPLVVEAAVGEEKQPEWPGLQKVASDSHKHYLSPEMMEDSIIFDKDYIEHIRREMSKKVMYDNYDWVFHGR